MKTIILVCAILCVLLGSYLHSLPPALPIGIDIDGNWLFSQSSGSNDGYLCAIALQAFAFTLLIGCLNVWWRLPYLLHAAYAVNTAVLLGVYALVLMDSDIWLTTQLGYVVPLWAAVIVGLPWGVGVIKMIQSHA